MHPFFLLFLLVQMARCQTSNKPATNATLFPTPKGIWTTEWSGDGKYIAVAGDDSTIWLYNSSNYSLYKSFKANSMVKGLSWHPTENLLAIANMKGVQLLDVKTETLTTLTDIKTGGRGIGWNYNGQLLALADGNGVVQIMNKYGKLQRSIPKNERKSFLSIHWHPSRNIILTGGDEIILFDTTGRQLNIFRIRDQYTGILSVRWHPSGEFFASGDYGHEDEGKPTLLQFWKIDGTLIKQISGHHKEIRNLRWSNDGKYIATAADALRIWSSKGELLYTGATEANLWGVAWSPDDKFIVTGTFTNGKVKLWNNHAKLIKELTP